MGSMTAQPKVILYDYQFAPNGQKARNLLNMCGITYQSCPQPFVQPRNDLLDLGITYRRVPVNFIGKDGYCDNRAFTEAVQEIFPDKALPTSPHDHAYEAFGYRSFWVCLPLVPAELLSKPMQADRRDLFAVFCREDFASLRPSTLAEFRQLLSFVEDDFLSHGKGRWVNGETCGLADVHASWMIKWALQTLSTAEEPGLGREDFPRVYAWIEGMPKHDEEGEAESIGAEEAKKVVLEGRYAAAEIGVDEGDSTGLKWGMDVKVAPNDDSKPENMYQYGKLVGLGRREMVIQLENGIRLHYPRIGYIMKKAAE